MSRTLSSIRSIQHCVQTYKKYKRLPIIIIFNTESTTIQLPEASLSPTMCGHILPSTFWATRAILINSNTINNPAHHNSFLMLATFIIQRHNSLLASDKWEDTTMKRLDIVKVLCDSGTKSMINIFGYQRTTSIRFANNPQRSTQPHQKTGDSQKAIRRSRWWWMKLEKKAKNGKGVMSWIDCHSKRSPFDPAISEACVTLLILGSCQQ